MVKIVYPGTDRKELILHFKDMNIPWFEQEYCTKSIWAEGRIIADDNHME